MKNFDVSVYGNTIVDTVYKVSSYREGHSNKSLGKYTSLGGTANTIQELSSLNKNLSISLHTQLGRSDNDAMYAKRWLLNFNKLYHQKLTTFLSQAEVQTSNALIISDVANNTRSSIVNWGACEQMKNFDFDGHNAKWSHFMYVDKLPNLTVNDLKRMPGDGIISVDFCLGEHSAEEKGRIFDLLQYVDYALISEAEASSLTGRVWEDDMAMDMGEICKGTAILHTPKGSHISDGNKVSIIESEFIENVPLNVLGAGDIFAASFINHMLESSCDDIEASVEFSHRNTTNKLKRKKNVQEV